MLFSSLSFVTPCVLLHLAVIAGVSVNGRNQLSDADYRGLDPQDIDIPGEPYPYFNPYSNPQSGGRIPAGPASGRGIPAPATLSRHPTAVVFPKESDSEPMNRYQQYQQDVARAGARDQISHPVQGVADFVYPVDNGKGLLKNSGETSQDYNARSAHENQDPRRQAARAEYEAQRTQGSDSKPMNRYQQYQQDVARAGARDQISHSVQGESDFKFPVGNGNGILKNSGETPEAYNARERYEQADPRRQADRAKYEAQEKARQEPWKGSRAPSQQVRGPRQTNNDPQQAQVPHSDNHNRVKLSHQPSQPKSNNPQRAAPRSNSGQYNASRDNRQREIDARQRQKDTHGRGSNHQSSKNRVPPHHQSSNRQGSVNNRSNRHS